MLLDYLKGLEGARFEALLNFYTYATPPAYIISWNLTVTRLIPELAGGFGTLNPCFLINSEGELSRGAEEERSRCDVRFISGEADVLPQPTNQDEPISNFTIKASDAEVFEISNHRSALAEGANYRIR